MAYLKNHQPLLEHFIPDKPAFPLCPLQTVCRNSSAHFMLFSLPGVPPFPSVRVHAKSLPVCLTLWNPMDHSLPGSSVHGILQNPGESSILQNPGVACRALFQGILPTQESNPSLSYLLY